MKVLLSWYAYNNDFVNGVVDITGPTYQFHQYFFDHDLHLVLSSMSGEDIRAEKLVNQILLDFPDQKDRIEIRYMNIPDIIDMPAIKAKVETLLLGLTADQIDLFISPGTPAMQVAWYFCHQSLKLPTRLFQTRAAKFTKTGRPELMPVYVEQSPIPVSVVVKENLQKNERSSSKGYLVSPSIQPTYSRAEKLARTDNVTCLIYGASGTGKEHLARYIHQESARSDKAFVAVNCSALGDSLLESRLFGYEKGAFTGAEKRTPGYFDEAQEGTLFLDEIGDISAYMQQVLLRVLQEQEYTPVGATKSKRSNIRIIAATHRSLREACQAGHFRWDLFYRLSVAELRLPSLVERGQAEKQALVNHFLRSKQPVFRRSSKLTLSAAAYQMIDLYTFPGNVRELENLIESLYVFSGDKADVEDMPEWLGPTTNSPDSFNWTTHERALIQRAMDYFGGNKSKACAALGYGSINTLVKKLKQYGIENYSI
ncbi:sigma-54-dependent Fis family transcriptional regulator [Fibrella sp. USSR17]